MSLSVLLSETPTYPPPADEIDRIRELQNACDVYVLPQTREFMQWLAGLGLVFSVRSATGEIIATAYQQPLDPTLGIHDPTQVFKIGGLALSKTAASSTKAFIRLITLLSERVNAGDLSVITGASSPAMAKLLRRRADCLEVSFDECRTRFFSFLSLFLRGAHTPVAPEELYKDKKLYVRTKQRPDPRDCLSAPRALGLSRP